MRSNCGGKASGEWQVCGTAKSRLACQLVESMCTICLSRHAVRQRQAIPVTDVIEEVEPIDTALA
jgi:hypothetical protein